MAWVQRCTWRWKRTVSVCTPRKSRHWESTASGGHIEILLRLHDEAGRMILPDSFIPAAERYGLMSRLDRWVVKNVFKVIAQCRAENGHGPLAMCAINLSGTTIGDEAFLDFLREQFVNVFNTA
jgi:EAL domain-containing protein (putative c-di-GMP-specific phosphodiesterase class I)